MRFLLIVMLGLLVMAAMTSCPKPDKDNGNVTGIEGSGQRAPDYGKTEAPPTTTPPESTAPPTTTPPEGGTTPPATPPEGGATPPSGGTTPPATPPVRTSTWAR